MSNEDAFFGPSYVDVDEWRVAPQRHRYVHGGFDGTDTRFSVYLPPNDVFDGRLFTSLEGGWAGHEDTMMSPLASLLGGIPLAFRLGGASS
jgi:hypothetical protein